MDVADPVSRPPGPPPGAGPGPAVSRRRQLLFRVVFPAVFLAYLLETAAAIVEGNGPAGEAAGFAIIAVFCAAHIGLLSIDLDCARPALFWTLFGVEVACLVGELPFAHEAAFVMAVFIVTVAVGRLSLRALPIVAAATAAAVLVPLGFPSWHEGIDTAVVDGTAFGIPLVGVAMVSFFGILRANRALVSARAEIAALAAANERTRIARDIHDLLGHSLTTIVVKAELARRLLGTDTEAAATELAEVIGLTRSSLAEVRAAISSYRTPDLEGELAAGADLLRAAGITATVPEGAARVEPRGRELFAWVLREGLTNVVRHSGATTCTVTLTDTTIDIVDDGNATAASTGDRTARASSGNGLAGLRERAAALGATMAAGPEPTGGWRLAVQLPPTASATPPDRPAVPDARARPHLVEVAPPTAER